jgi:hypothetical protein
MGRVAYSGKRTPRQILLGLCIWSSFAEQVSGPTLNTAAPQVAVNWSPSQTCLPAASTIMGLLGRLPALAALVAVFTIGTAEGSYVGGGLTILASTDLTGKWPNH